MTRAVPILAALMLLSGCAARRQAFPMPPALPVVQVPLPPVSETALVWQPGDWTYTSGSYRYDPGYYIPAKGHATAWIFGHWTPERDGYVWVPGRWQVPGMQ